MATTRKNICHEFLKVLRFTRRRNNRNRTVARLARQAANAKPLQFLSVCKFQWVLQVVQGYL